MNMADSSLTPIDSCNPWLIEKDRFIKYLSEATSENLHYKSSNIQKADQKTSRTRAILRSLDPLTKAIQDYGSAMDTFANTSPAQVAPLRPSKPEI